ncbi:actin interacting protein 3-domain-containing protein [Phascolomyces articulosus]|uniref:Actin interacting protein 3-domain-containing protein n=1 Tax=Phascolomyces articulosus TaxID=60185 RepID=A0AAD5JTS1_9FUNG|nr:actin interacting protein 3-domain-containing protein [Phascolomyces articulosus]
MLMETNNKDDLERHKAATVSLVSPSPSPPPQQQPLPTITTSNMSTAVTEPQLSTLKRSHTITSSLMTDIEQTITKLLTCTKKFLEALTSWSLDQVSNDQVINIYQDLADQFERVKKSLQAAQLTMSDVEHIPEELYECLITMLDNYAPSKPALEQHLPSIRDIILYMLQSLKKKQAQLRESSSSTTTTDISLSSPRRISGGSQSSGNSTMSSSISSPLHASYNMATIDSNRSSSTTTISSSSRNYKTGSSDLDMTDVNTQNALAELKQQENLARRSSIRRSMIAPSTLSTLQMNTTHIPDISDGDNTYSPVTPPRRHPTLIRNSKRVSQQQPTSSTTLHETRAIKEEGQETKKNGAFPLFLQLGDQVKKIMWQQQEPVTQAALGMAFFEKFDLRDENNSNIIIKIQDPVSRIMYELEDMNDVGPHTLLSLVSFTNNSSTQQPPTSSLLLSSQDNVNMISEKLDRIHQALQEQKLIPNQQHHETTTISSSPPPRPPMTALLTDNTAMKSQQQNDKKNYETMYNAEMIDHTILQQQQDEIEHLRRDLGVLRQVAKEFQQETTTLLHELRNTISTTETKKMHPFAAFSAGDTTKDGQMNVDERGNPHPTNDNNNNNNNQRSYVMETKKRAETVSTEITGRMQDLQDTIEQLKLDVTQRRCRPSQTQLNHCDKETKVLEQEIEQLSKLLRSVKPVWKTTWEVELQTVVKEQQFLKEQETLLLDLRDDHADLLNILRQLQKISEIQQQTHRHGGSGGVGGTKNFSKRGTIPPLSTSRSSSFRGASSNSSIHSNGTSSSGEEQSGDMSSVLKQVSTIEVDHGKRVKALQQAEKMRARELANRIDDFEKELSTFVGAKKLKKTGGADHVDRQRQKKDQQILRDLYQSKNDNNNK